MSTYRIRRQHDAQEDYHAWWMQQKADRIHAERQAAKTAPTPQPDHGAAGFCTDHGQAPDDRVETVAQVLREHRLNFGPDDNGECCQAGDWTEGNGDVALEDHQAAAVVAALDDESPCSVCDAADEVRADATRHAGWSEAMRFAHHAHASETSNGYMSANGVLGAGPDAVIVDGDWLAQVEADLTAAREALDRVRALFAAGPDTSCRTVWRETENVAGEPPIPMECVEVPMADLRAALDPEEPR